MSKRNIIIAAASLVLISIIVTVTLYSSRDYSYLKKLVVVVPDDQKVVQELVPVIQRNYEGLGAEIEFIYADNSYYFDEIKALMEDGVGDLFYVVNNRGVESPDLYEHIYQHSFRSSYLRKLNKGAKSFFNINGNILYVPVTASPWGIYYNKERFAKAGIKEPKVYEELLSILEEGNLEGILASSNHLWTLTSWFDHISIGLHGVDFHRKLIKGEIPFTDERVSLIYNELINFVSKNYIGVKAYDRWEDMVEKLESGEASMLLGGSFIYDEVKNKEAIGFFPFPHMENSNAQIVSSSGFIVSNKSENIAAVEVMFSKVLLNSFQRDIASTSFNPVTKKWIRGSNRDDLIKTEKSLRKKQGVSSLERGGDPYITRYITASIKALLESRSMDSILEELEKLRLDSRTKNN